MSLARLPIPPRRHILNVLPQLIVKDKGGNRIRTDDEGFADLCLTTWLYRHIKIRQIGLAGFEPAHNGVKVHCLTAWL